MILLDKEGSEFGKNMQLILSLVQVEIDWSGWVGLG